MNKEFCRKKRKKTHNHLQESEKSSTFAPAFRQMDLVEV